MLEKNPAIDNALLTDKRKNFAGNPMFWLQTAALLSGFALLYLVVYKIGLKTLLEVLSRIGWGFLLIIFLNGCRHVLRAFCLYLAIPPALRTIKFRSVFAARLGGEAVSFLTFTGPFLGETTKAVLLKKNVAAAHGGAAVIIDNFLYYVSVVIVILSGASLMAFVYRGGGAIEYALFGIVVFAALGFVMMALLFWFRVKPAIWLVGKLSARGFAPRFVLKKEAAIYELENNVHEFYANRRAAFFAIVCLIFLSHALSVCEVWAALALLGFSSSVSNAFIIESLTKAVNFSFSFVPGAIGVYESGNAAILSALGFAAAVGVALALARRGAILFWTLVGLLVLLRRSLTRGAALSPKESVS